MISRRSRTHRLIVRAAQTLAVLSTAYLFMGADGGCADLYDINGPAVIDGRYTLQSVGSELVPAVLEDSATVITSGSLELRNVQYDVEIHLRDHGDTSTVHASGTFTREHRQVTLAGPFAGATPPVTVFVASESVFRIDGIPIGGKPRSATFVLP